MSNLIPQQETQMPAVAAQLENTARQLTALVDKLALMNLQSETRVRELEKLLRERVTITAAEGRAISTQGAAKARELCERHGLPYDVCGSYVRAQLWKGFKRVFNVSSVYDLPAASIEDARAYIRKFSSFTVITEARKRMDGKEVKT